MRMIDADAMREDWLYNGENEYVYDTNAVLDSIDSQPTIDPESLRQRGEWVVLKHDEESGCDIFGCSECRKVTGIVKPRWEWCPECGDKMDAMT